MLRHFLTVFLLLMSSVCMADSYQYLVVGEGGEGGGETGFAISQIERITFSSTDMNIELTDGTIRQIPLLSLSKLFFSADDFSALASATASGSSIRMSDGVLRVDVATGERVTIFNLKGLQVLTATESLTLDFDHLPKGVYIVKVGQQTKKFLNN